MSLHKALHNSSAAMSGKQGAPAGKGYDVLFGNTADDLKGAMLAGVAT